MSDPFNGESIPRPALAGIGALIALALLLALWGSQQRSVAEDVDRVGGVALDRELVFSDVGGGELEISDAQSQQVVMRIPPGQQNFIRGVVRGFARERRSRDIAAEVPLVLRLMRDGSLILEDPGTGRDILLDAFGNTNRTAFAVLLNTTTDDRQAAAGDTL